MGVSLARRNPQTSEWLRYMSLQGKKTNTITGHERNLNQLLRYIESEGGVQCDQVDFQHLVTIRVNGVSISGAAPVNARWVNEFLGWLVRPIADPEQRGGKRNRAISTLRLFFDHLKTGGVLLEDPMYHVELAKITKKVNHRKYLTPTESAALLRAAVRSGEHAPRNVAVMTTLLRSGLRPSELCTLPGTNLDFETGWILVDGKEGRRGAPMPPALKGVLRLYQSSPYFRRHCVNKNLSCLFPNDRSSGPMTTDELRGLVKKLCESAGIDRGVTTYWTRHTFATDAYRSGLPFVLVSLALGHKKLKNTEIYVHGREDRLRRIAGRGPAVTPLVEIHRKLLKLVD